MSKDRKSLIHKDQQYTPTYVEKLAVYFFKYRYYSSLVIGLISTVILGTFLWYAHQEKRNILAQTEMYQAIYEFESNNLDNALLGNEAYAGFLDIIKNYRFTKAANLAHLYAGISYLHQGHYNDAIIHLQQFKSTDYLFKTRAWSLIGDAYSQQQDYHHASIYYIKAANDRSSDFFTPTYLSKAAIAYEANGQYKEAKQCYERIIADYSKSFFYDEACKHISRLTSLQ